MNVLGHSWFRPVDFPDEPSINGYFSYLQYADDLEQRLSSPDVQKTCNNQPDNFLCSLEALLKACNREDEVGEHVRTKCTVRVFDRNLYARMCATNSISSRVHSSYSG
jgi:hypothetical protein